MGDRGSEGKEDIQGRSTNLSHVKVLLGLPTTPPPSGSDPLSSPGCPVQVCPRSNFTRTLSLCLTKRQRGVRWESALEVGLVKARSRDLGTRQRDLLSKGAIRSHQAGTAARRK